MNTIHQSDSLQGLKNIDNGSVNCCITSPPYWGLRDYGVDGQLGLEKTPEEYVKKIVAIFHEVKRVLKDDGTLWLNLGDSYAGSGKGYGDVDPSPKQSSNKGTQSGTLKPNRTNNLKPKDLVGIPWMVAFALRADGWYLRQDIIWNKPNPMPESVTDRCTKSHEYIFLLSKSAKYYYDAEAIKTPLKKESEIRLAQKISEQKGSDRVPGKINGSMKAVVGGRKRRIEMNSDDPMYRKNSNREYLPPEDLKANKKSVWTVATQPYKEAHFATFPQKLIVDCIKAGCPEGGIVLDPFMGAGTTAVVAKKLDRNYLGFEINPEYIKIANKRLHNEIGLFL